MKNLNKIFAVAAISALCLQQATAQTPGRGSTKWSANAQQMINKLGNLRPSLAHKDTKNKTRERVRAIFVDYGNGNDSITFSYNSLRRGSSYDYSQLSLFGYDNGYRYLNNVRKQVQFDSMNYITDVGYSGTYEPYSFKTSTFDTFLNNTSISGGINNASGVFVPSYKSSNTFSPTKDLTQTVDSNNYLAGAFTTSNISYLATYYAPSKLLQSQEFGFFPTKTENTYNPAGLIINQNLYEFDSVVTHDWSVIPYSSNIYTYDASGNQLTEINLASDTAKYIRTYNAANQKLSEMQQAWNAATASYDTVNIMHFVYPNDSTDWSISTLTIFDPVSGAWGYVTDSTTRTFDASSQVLTSNEYFDDGAGTNYTGTITNTWYARGKLSSVTTAFIQPDVDTLLDSYILTFNAAGNPITCKHYATEGYGGPTPDVVSNLKDTYYYETYTEPTAIKEPTIKLNVAMYPNPSYDLIHISCSEMKTAQITITNMSGRVLRQHQIQLGSSEAVINIKDLPAGIYLVSLKDEKTGQSTTKQLSKVNR